MHSYQSIWQDEQLHRTVEVMVNYSLAETGVSIAQVTPTRVTFLCPETKSELRSIGVFTERSRNHLVQVLDTAGHLEQLPQEIAAAYAMDTSA